MKTHRNQWIVMSLYAPKVPYRALISPQAILYEGYKPSYGQYMTDFSVVSFRPGFMRVSEECSMKSHINQ